MDPVAPPSSSICERIPRPELAKRVLLIDVDKRQQRAIAQILRCFAEGVEVCEKVSDPIDPTYDLVIARYNALTPEQRERIALDADGKGQPRLLLFSEARSREDFSEIFNSRGLANLVARDDEHDITDFIVTIQKILRDEIFGIEKYFSWGIVPVEFRLQRSGQKPALLQHAEEYATSIGINGRMVDLFCTVVDELFTNAIYNAPRDKDGTYRYAHLSRTQEVVLAEGEEVTVKFCSDGRRLGISVSDPFGSLQPSQIRNYLAKCFRKDENQVDQKAGGAGLGLYYVFESLSHFVINVAAGRRTEAIGLFDVRGSYKDFASRVKSFNIFVSEA